METDWSRLAGEASYILDLLARRPNRLEIDLLIVAVGRIEKLLNPNRWPFADRRRQHIGCDSELCRGWMKVRETVDQIIVALELESCCEGRGQSWSVSTENELPSLPTPIPNAWIESLAHGRQIIGRTLAHSAEVGNKYYCVAAQTASLVHGKWIGDDPQPTKFLMPIIDAAVQVERALKVFVLLGDEFVPDCPVDSSDYNLGWLGIQEKAKSLQRVIEKTYRFSGRDTCGGPVRRFAVHEVDIGNIGIEQNIAAHRMYDCVGKFIAGFRRGVPKTEVDAFVRCLEVLRDGLPPPAPKPEPSETALTTRRPAPPCKKCGKPTKITSTGRKYRHWKCKNSACGATGKQVRVTDNAM